MNFYYHCFCAGRLRWKRGKGRERCHWTSGTTRTSRTTRTCWSKRAKRSWWCYWRTWVEGKCYASHSFEDEVRTWDCSGEFNRKYSRACSSLIPIRYCPTQMYRSESVPPSVFVVEKNTVLNSVWCHFWIINMTQGWQSLIPAREGYLWYMFWAVKYAHFHCFLQCCPEVQCQLQFNFS